MSATRWGAMVTGAGEGAAIENIAPVKSMRVDGPGAWRISKFSTNSAETICMAPKGTVGPMGYTAAPEGWWQSFVSALPARTGKLAVTRLDGSPHVAPVWVDLDGDDVIFMTSGETIKGKSILRDGRVALCFDDERPPFSFVTLSGHTTTSTDAAELLTWATRIAARYMGQAQAEAYGRRNAVPPEMVVRVHVEHVIAVVDVAD